MAWDAMNAWHARDARMGVVWMAWVAGMAGVGRHGRCEKLVLPWRTSRRSGHIAKDTGKCVERVGSNCVLARVARVVVCW